MASCLLIVAGCTTHGTEPSAASSTRRVALARLGQHAEDLYDTVFEQDWKAATTLMGSLRADVGAAIPRTRTDLERQVGESMALLGPALETRERSTALIESNRLTGLAARLQVDTGAAPVDVTLLDYFGRELTIHGGAGNASAVAATVDSIDAVWARLKPRVEARNNPGVLARFDSLVHALDAAPTTEAKVKLATPILDEVDHLEGVFAAK